MGRRKEEEEVEVGRRKEEEVGGGGGEFHCGFSHVSTLDKLLTKAALGSLGRTLVLV